ncbi:hypothetical protein Ctha_2179 [Chloroherpeton thalassium ATCC 35110]|uniref:Uncharacterized protein n=1 Tax=Chloroherpeton thalassium (strain ATCC 35110 / GB-78) TaxID=517418 RepID=B3QVX6_CHLT3|nr:hypothetical protein [Chloroherpeton thalassium]ACF14630.1 hypothetical protein Ctha_2179 [Chloroherpeton thalassium ATCC 35110]
MEIQIPLSKPRTRFSKIAQFIHLSLLLFLFGCSDALNQIITPFGPDFTLEAQPVAGGVEINFQNAPLPTASFDNVGSSNKYDILYGIYIYRAESSPYGDYELVKRVFNSEAAKSYLDVTHELKGSSSRYYIDVTYEVQNFTLYAGFSHGAINEVFQGYSTTIDETVEAGKTYFYRVEVVQYEYRKENVEFTINEKTIIKQNISNRLDSNSISAWVEVTFN